MSRFKSKSFVVYNGVEPEHVSVSIMVNARGMFYCNLSDVYALAVKGSTKSNANWFESPGIIKLEYRTYDQLESAIQSALNLHYKPVELEEHIIRYNIESHVSFAEDSSGNIFPNAGFADAKWLHKEGQYGNLSDSNSSQGGYSLTIGAKALTKRTLSFGTASSVEYTGYYKGKSHLGSDNPAQLLNSWCSFYLPKDAKEIPYTDEAALFFYNLLYGLARLSKQIQDHTFDQKDLLSLVERGGKLLT